MTTIELSRRAMKDLAALDPQTRKRVVAGLRRLGDDEANLDMRALEGPGPWLRFRVGEHRVVLRRLTDDDARRLGGPGHLIARIVPRQALGTAIANLRRPP